MAGGPSASGRLRASDAADALGLPVDAVLALAAAGFLATDEGPGGLRFAARDIERFSSRNRPRGAATTADAPAGLAPGTNPDLSGGARVLAFPTAPTGRARADPASLLGDLARSAGLMAEQVLESYLDACPDAQGWGRDRRNRFVTEASARFEAVLALVEAGDDVDEDLLVQLGEVGAGAARSGIGLPEVLITIRISRDVVVQTALALGRDRGADPTDALASLLGRTLPAVDRLTDAVASGYWRAAVDIRAEIAGRYEVLVEHATDAIAEIDPGGCIRYANPAFGRMVGRSRHQLVGVQARHLASFAEGPDVDDLLGPERTDAWQELRFRRLDGIERLVQARVVDRRVGGELMGYLGVMRDVTAERDLARHKDAFVDLVSVELRNPLAVVLGLGITLETYAGDLDHTRVARIGKAIRSHAERIARLTDDLADVGHLESHSLLLSPRPVEVAHAVAATLGMLSHHPGVERVELAGDLDAVVHADPRRLEQVLAHLVENALVHGAEPVRCEVLRGTATVEIVVRDHGTGLATDRIEAAFSEVHAVRDLPRGRARGRPSSAGLSLARGLIEAMGGRLEYQAADEGGACFVVTLPR